MWRIVLPDSTIRFELIEDDEAFEKDYNEYIEEMSNGSVEGYDPNEGARTEINTVKR